MSVSRDKAKAYLMAALFNSVSTIDNHYTMLVNHDFHSGL